MYAMGAIRKTWLMQAVGSEGNPVSNHLIRRHLYKSMKKVEDQYYKTWSKNKLEGIQAATKYDEKIALAEQINNEDSQISGAALMEHAARNLGDPKFGGNIGLSRQSSTAVVKDLITEGYVTNIDNLLKHRFTPKGWPEGKTTTFEDHFPKEADELKVALLTAQRQKVQNLNSTQETKALEWVQKNVVPIVEKGEGITMEELADLRKRFREENRGVQIPTYLANLQSNKEQDDRAILDRLIIKAANLEVIKPDDYAGITHPAVLKEAKELAATTVNNLDPSNQNINPSVDAKTIYQSSKLAVKAFQGNLLAQRKYQNMLTFAIAEQYRKESKVLGPGNHDAAYAAA